MLDSGLLGPDTTKRPWQQLLSGLFSSLFQLTKLGPSVLVSTGKHRLFLNVSVPWIPLTPLSDISSLHLAITSSPPPQFCGPQASPFLILWQLTHGYNCPPPGLWSVFSGLFLSARNRHLFWKDLGLSALNLVITLKVDKVRLLLKVLSRLPLETSPS